MADISDELKGNYRRLRAQRGCTWGEMAEQFERDGEQTVSSSVMRDPASYAALAAWARSQEATDAPAPQPAQAKPPRRDTRQQPPARTA